MLLREKVQGQMLAHLVALLVVPLAAPQLAPLTALPVARLVAEYYACIMVSSKFGQDAKILRGKKFAGRGEK